MSAAVMDFMSDEKDLAGKRMANAASEPAFRRDYRRGSPPTAGPCAAPGGNQIARQRLAHVRQLAAHAAGRHAQARA